MQISNSFDAVTIAKIKHSALLGSAGFFLAVIPILLADPQVTEFLQDHLIIGAAVAAYIPVAINAVRQYLAGQQRSELDGREEEVSEKVVTIAHDVKEQAQKEVAEEAKNEKSAG